MADTRLYELEECVSPQADDILLIEESATQTDKKVKVSSLMPTDAVESAVADWLTAHPEATTTVEDGSITPVKLATSTMDLFDEKANTAGEYDDMTVGSAKQLLSKGYTENKTPYIYRASAGGDRVYEKLIGGTIAWNQLVQDKNSTTYRGITYSIINNVVSLNGTADGQFVISFATPIKDHVMFVDVKYNGTPTQYVTQDAMGRFYNSKIYKHTHQIVNNYYLMVPNEQSIDETFTLKIHDLTQLFGTTIADYIYSLEQATAGAGVAYFRQMFPNEYYAYDTGSLQSVNVASKKVYDSNNALVATYTFDSDLTLRGIPKLDANNNLYYDGDVYESNGTVTRKYGIVDLGTLNWSYSSRNFLAPLNTCKNETIKMITLKDYEPKSSYSAYSSASDKAMYKDSNGNLYIKVSSYTDAQTFKTAMSGVYLVYELATPTTESADTYINPQMVDADGTEEFVDYAQSQGTRDVAVPVGHESKYMINLRQKIEDATMLPTLPTTNGTYTLKCTVASGVPTLSWVAD